jgi:hypothetical protein
VLTCKAHLAILIDSRPVDGMTADEIEVWGQSFCLKLVCRNPLFLESSLLSDSHR